MRREGGGVSDRDRRGGEGSAFPQISGEKRRPPKKKARGSPPANPEKQKKPEKQKIDEDTKEETETGERSLALLSYFPFDFFYFAPEWVFSACLYGAQQLVLACKQLVLAYQELVLAYNELVQQLVLAYKQLAQQLVLVYRELAQQCVGAWGVAYAYGIQRAEDVSVQVLISLLALLVQEYVLY
jgi:hypothetical protein